MSTTATKNPKVVVISGNGTAGKVGNVLLLEDIARQRHIDVVHAPQNPIILGDLDDLVVEPTETLPLLRVEDVLLEQYQPPRRWKLILAICAVFKGARAR